MASSHQWIHLFASVCEVSGTFLLAVEAIKIDNLKAVREKFFGRMVRLLTFRIWVPKDASPKEIASRVERAELWVYAFLTAVGFGVILAIGSLGTGSISALLLSIKNALPIETWLAAIAIFLAGCVVATFSAILGFLLYSVILLPFKATFQSLAWIEAKTASGVIGILGFVVFFVGAVIHAVLAWNAP